jgi:hypothetical protein
MKHAQFFHSWFGRATVLCLLVVPSITVTADIFDEGPESTYQESVTTPWQELGVALPVYPGDVDSLLELHVSTGGLPYRVYLDPASLATGEDRVVRYTAVLVSSTGIRNVTYEGLHCGKRNYRRFAYGSGGKWHTMKDSSWLRISGTGAYQYRKLLYEQYLCDPTAVYHDAAVLVRKLRYANPLLDVE